MKLSVVIPAYNEEKRITKTLESVNEYLTKQDFDYEILVVANNCTDNTDKVVLDLKNKIKNLELMDIGAGIPGKGGAVKVGFLKAQGEYIMFMDADNATKINELDHFWNYFDEGYDIVIGSRDTKGSKVVVSQAWYKELAGKIGNLLIQIVALPGIHDTQCGFKIFKQKVVKDVFPIQKLGGWGFDIEILALAKKFGYKIKEEPITWFNAVGSKVSMGDYLHVFSDLFKVRWWLWTGVYKVKKL
ncbi:MAG: dolichyl-phosphate beta-glucosyltransferase [Patescibacteria group bacterium]|jgi:dolichyl-phosphate beta-glucosyltransferase